MAIAKEEQQYEDTMVRLQAMYEKGEDSYLSILLETQSLSLVTRKATVVLLPILFAIRMRFKLP